LANYDTVCSAGMTINWFFDFLRIHQISNPKQNIRIQWTQSIRPGFDMGYILPESFYSELRLESSAIVGTPLLNRIDSPEADSQAWHEVLKPLLNKMIAKSKDGVI
jgi:hypothetical protein